jgi:hypothetical protein
VSWRDGPEPIHADLDKSGAGMQKYTLWMTLTLCLLAVNVSSAQQSRKAGLWMISTTTRIQQQGESPANLGGHPGQSSSEPVGLPACLTQEVVDKFGVILPPSLRDCELSNVVQAADSFHADMTCKGSYNGVGSVESTWTDEDHVAGKVRFVSRTGEAGKGRQLTWSQESTAVFKSSDCGNVKPRQIPVKPTPAKPLD